MGSNFAILSGQAVAEPRPVVSKSPNGVRVIPYNASYAADADLFLPWFWQKLKADGLVELYYPGQAETGFANFVRLMSGGNQIALVVAQDSEGQPEKAVGFVSWEPMIFGHANAAMAGFIFFREFWDHRYSDDAAQKVMEYWFSNTDLDVVVGAIATANRAAMRFVQRNGWKQAGVIPLLHQFAGKQSDCAFWYVTRKDWEGR